ncbi:MAG: hypothetical protein GY789_06615 [Hyphomicrobiales bacterium]|nr:hypothetical protein [Hyphomicrobiales bacterium]MCP5000809.1 hypothetical protein [Hyphomicrobiales bacterium]
MSDQQPDDLQAEAESWIEPGQKNIQLVYILYLVSLATLVTLIIGMVMAYMNRGNSSESWIDNLYTYAIRTFWIGLLYGFISAVTTFILIGFVLMFLTAVWFVIRCLKGLQAAGRKEPIQNLETWLV